MTSPHHHPSYPPPSPHSTPTPTPQARYAPPPPPPPPFSPFFTLISTPHTTAHKHPIVHYIFADDDIDPTLPSDPNPNPTQNQSLNPSTDRVIIVDVGATTTDVSAVSLSHDWQVLGVKIEAAPQWAGETAGGGLMLTVEGTDANVVQKRGERERGMGMEELAEVYGERMALLKRVVEFGGGGGAQTA